MSDWKKIGMIVGGIAAVALAGPTGGLSLGAAAALAATTGVASTAAGVAGAAAAGAAVGAAAGHMVDKKNKKKEEEAYQRGRQEATAELAVRLQKMKEQIDTLSSATQRANEHYRFTIALFATGMAAANAVGKNSSEDKDNLLEFIAGLSANELPDKVKAVIENYKQNPPTIKEAIAEIRKLQTIAPSEFRNVILLVFDDEGGETPAGKLFLEEWDKVFA